MFINIDGKPLLLTITLSTSQFEPIMRALITFFLQNRPPIRIKVIPNDY